MLQIATTTLEGRSVLLALPVLEERAVAAPRELLEPPAHVGVRLTDGGERKRGQSGVRAKTHNFERRCVARALGGSRSELGR